MPSRSSEYVHVAVTDHTIGRHAESTAHTPAAPTKTLAAWVEPPAKLRLRNLALANLTAGLRLGMTDLVETGLQLAAAMPRNEFENDPVLLEASCRAQLGNGKTSKAVELCRLAARLQPGNADRVINLGIALARAKDFTGAERELKRAIALDPSFKHAYVQLWTLYDTQGNVPAMAETMRQFLEWNPQNIMFRVLRESLPQQPAR
jgi:predicted Zn-dependent protease